MNHSYKMSRSIRNSAGKNPSMDRSKTREKKRKKSKKEIPSKSKPTGIPQDHLEKQKKLVNNVFDDIYDEAWNSEESDPIGDLQKYFSALRAKGGIFEQRKENMHPDEFPSSRNPDYMERYKCTECTTIEHSAKCFEYSNQCAQRCLQGLHDPIDDDYFTRPEVIALHKNTKFGDQFSYGPSTRFSRCWCGACLYQDGYLVVKEHTPRQSAPKIWEFVGTERQENASISVERHRTREGEVAGFVLAIVPPDQRTMSGGRDHLFGKDVTLINNDAVSVAIKKTSMPSFDISKIIIDEPKTSLMNFSYGNFDPPYSRLERD